MSDGCIDASNLVHRQVKRQETVELGAERFHLDVAQLLEDLSFDLELSLRSLLALHIEFIVVCVEFQCLQERIVYLKLREVLGWSNTLQVR